jgi:hypothetical protein
VAKTNWFEEIAKNIDFWPLDFDPSLGRKLVTPDVM